jgi:16S rRNA (guanine527-N7)-methyltransferase
MNNISEMQAADILGPYGVQLDSHLYEKISVYMSTLLQWNERMSLTTVREPSQILRFHFGECLFALNALIVPNSRLADVGSGAGFPGLAIAMARPGSSITLIDSNHKKTAFLSEVTRRLALTNVKVVRSRIEEFSPGPGSFDLVTSRAFGQFERLLCWCRAVLSVDGKVALWLGEADAKSISSIGEDWHWQEPLRIPGSEKRVIIAGNSTQ